MQLDYLKMHGAGNRILVVDNRAHGISPPGCRTRLQRLGDDDATGPGFDQLMWISTASNAKATASYRVFNADGSEVEQCGNGVRCVASMLSKETGGESEILLESPAGIVTARVSPTGQIAVSMGAPIFEPADVPFMSRIRRADRYAIDVEGRRIRRLGRLDGQSALRPAGRRRSSGRRRRDARPLDRTSRTLSGARERWLHGDIRGRSDIDLRVHERGVGETAGLRYRAHVRQQSSGSASGYLDHEVAVRLPGGQLMVSWRGGRRDRVVERQRRIHQ